MQWIKAHLNVVVAGSVSLLAAVALVLGVLLTNVAEGMHSSESLFPSLHSAGGLPKSALDAMTAEQLKRHDELVEMLKQMGVKSGDHKPLPIADRVFPKIDRDNQDAPFRFKEDFAKKQKELLVMLKAQDRPSDEEIKDEEKAIIQRRTQELLEQGRERENRGVVRPVQPTTVFGAANTTGSNTIGLAQVGPNATPEELVKEVPEVRAAVAQAHRKGYLCYAAEASLDPRPRITDPQVQKPQLEDMWYAQVSLWIQEDVLGALAGVNEERAKKLPPQEQWVGNMPFKRLVSFAVGGYVPEPTQSTGGPWGGGSGGGPSGDIVGGMPPMEAVSKRGCKGAVDVIQFSIRMVVEARALPEIIDAICDSGFYTVLQVNYEAVNPYVDSDGYVYGSRPVIDTWMLCEGSLLRTNATYAKLMPDPVKEAIQSGKLVGGGGSGYEGGGAVPGGFGGPPMGGGRMMPGMMPPGGGRLRPGYPGGGYPGGPGRRMP
jgi:hypothetical protein